MLCIDLKERALEQNERLLWTRERVWRIELVESQVRVSRSHSEQRKRATQHAEYFRSI